MVGQSKFERFPQLIASLAESISLLPEADRLKILADLSEDELDELEYDWRFWGRPTQFAPDGDWSTWIALAGRGFGKTEAGAQWIKERVRDGAMSIALVAETHRDLKSVMVPRILSLYGPKDNNRPEATYSPVRLVWPSGAIAMGYNGTEPDQLRGPEFDTAWVDELAKYRRARETWDMLQFTMRSGDDPRVFVTTTPRPIPVIRNILDDETTAVTRGSTFDNARNLPKTFLEGLKKRYGGTRLGRQELNAEMLNDTPGALWNESMFNRVRELPERIIRVVVAIDPSGAGSERDEGADEIGIIAAGLLPNDRYIVLEDATMRGGPDQWAKTAIGLFDKWKADRIVAERNFGGAMVESTIRNVSKKAPVLLVTASRGKAVRAEPVAALYEQGRVDHYSPPRVEDALLLLETQMTEMASYGFVGEGSPDRLDAAVWALSSLSDGSGYTLDNL